MDFRLSSTQLALQESVRRFCRDWKLPRWSSQDTSSSRKGFDRALWKKFAELGWLGISLPTEVGGMALGPIESAIVQQEFGRSLVVEPYWSCAVFAAQLIRFAAGLDTCEGLLRRLIAGDLVVVFGHREPHSSWTMNQVKMEAKEVGDRFVLNGAKVLVVGAPYADRFIISARTEGASADSAGISIFLIDKSTEGLFRRDYQLLDGRMASDLTFVDLKVGKDALLGGCHGGYSHIVSAANHAILSLCAEGVGVIDRVLWLTRDYLRLRRQYGTTLSTFQALQHRMADMFVEVELSRSIFYRALAALVNSRGVDADQTILAAYILVCKSGMMVCRNGVQLHGAIAMTEEHLIGRYFKRMAVIAKLFGGVEAHLDTFCKSVCNIAF